MIAKYRSETAPPIAEPVPSSEERKLAFVCLPTPLLKKAPIRYRDEALDIGLSVFEFALAATCAALARAKLVGTRQAAASRRGRSAGINFKWPTDGVVVVETSIRELFRVAGLSRKLSNLDRLPQALRRLTEPLPKFASALSKWRKSPSGRIELHVRAEWFPPRRFDRVPWPLPTSGPTILTLFLFLFGADRRPETDISIEVEKLYRLLGIAAKRPAHAQRSLDRALKRVNQHLSELNCEGALDRAELPVEFHVVPILRGTRVQFRPEEVGEDRVAPSRLRAYFRALGADCDDRAEEPAPRNEGAEFYLDADGYPQRATK
ncbi:MAG TPA: hypothetical protein VKW08_26900 [Xanthobacteraceae bacterium]|nr:hypothetical protein [Xanthobacteraceae bacterium]